MQKANDLPQSRLSHFKIRLNIADVRTVSVLEQHIRTVSAMSVFSPYCIRCYPLLSAENVGQFVHPLLHPYWLRTLSVLSPPILTNVKKFRTVSVLSTRNFIRPLSAPIHSIRA